MPDCIFCKIINRKLPAKIEYEDEDILAFFDIKPAAKVHIIIVPKKHIESIKNIEKEDIEIIGKMIYTAKAIAQKKGLKGYKLIFNVGREGGQIVDHLHLHLLGGQNLKTLV